MITEILILLCTVLLVVYAVTWMRMSRGYPPGPPRFPVIGSLLSIRDPDSLLHKTLTKMIKTYGDMYTLYLPSKPTIVINTYKIAREALINQKDTFSGRPYLFVPHFFSRGGKGFSDFGPAMALARKMVHSALRIYQPYLEDKITDEGRALVERFSNYENQPFDPKNDFSLVIANVVFSIIYGKRFDLDDEELHESVRYNNMGGSVLGPICILNVFPWLIHFPIPSSRIIKDIMDHRARVKDARFYEVKKTFQENQIRHLIDALLQAKLEEERDDTNSVKHMTDDHMMAITDAVFGAGSETTATALRWGLAYVLNYPDIQERIYEEIKDVYGSDGTIELKKRKDCHFLEAFMTEVLRCATIGPLFAHKATCDTTLCGYHVPQDTTILLNLWAINHDPKEWENPYEFKPSRFLDSNGEFTGTQKMSYLPFGAGRRSCVGEALAKKEMFLMSAILFQKLKFENPAGSPLPDIHDGTLGISYAVKPFKVVAKPRTI